MTVDLQTDGAHVPIGGNVLQVSFKMFLCPSKIPKQTDSNPCR